MRLETNKIRYDWIDIWRGVVIILIVIGHAGIPYLGGFAYLFHVSVFFFITGLITSFNKYEFWDFFKSKFKRLIVPFIAVNLIFYTLVYSLQSMEIAKYFYSDAFRPLEWIQLFLVLRTVDLGGATWFLVVMFFSLIISYIVIKLSYYIEPTSKIKYSAVLIGFLLLISSYSIQRSGISIIYNLDLALVAAFYMISANAIKAVAETKQYNPNLLFSYKKIVTLLFVSGLCLMVFYLKGSPVDWPIRAFHNPLTDIAQTGLGVVFTFSLALVVSKVRYLSRILVEIGKASLVILCFHFLIFRMYFLALYVFGFSDAGLLLRLTPPMGTSVVSLVILVGISILLTTLLSLIMGKFKRTKNLFSL